LFVGAENNVKAGLLEEALHDVNAGIGIAYTGTPEKLKVSFTSTAIVSGAEVRDIVGDGKI
jgi:hypothetical protein